MTSKSSFCAASSSTLSKVYLGVQCSRIVIFGGVGILLCQVSCQFVEQFHNSLILFGRTFLILHLISPRHFLSLLWNLMLNVLFVSYQIYTLFSDPLFNSFVYVVITLVDCSLLCEIKNTDAALAAFIVCWSQWTEFLLASCVPDLEWIIFVIKACRVGFEVYANGRSICTVKFGLSQSIKNGAFSDSLRTNYDDLECSWFNVHLCLVHFFISNINILTLKIKKMISIKAQKLTKTISYTLHVIKNQYAKYHLLLALSLLFLLSFFGFVSKYGFILHF